MVRTLVNGQPPTPNSQSALIRWQLEIGSWKLLTTPTNDGPGNLIECHERRPNNWGTHCGASRMAVAAYLGDRDELMRAAQVFKGYLGDRAAFAGFKYGDLAWQCNPRPPVGINPKGCVVDGHSLDV